MDSAGGSGAGSAGNIPWGRTAPPARPASPLRLGADASEPAVLAESLEVLADGVLVQAGPGDDVGRRRWAAGFDLTEDALARR